MTLEAGSLLRYVPSVALEWDARAGSQRHLQVEGTLVFADISGFTSLSERLTARGRIGAEELTAVLDRVFGLMLDIVHARGGSMIKFGGDALLLLFEGESHAIQATSSAIEMRSALRDVSREPTSVGRMNLRMSTGVHTGVVDLFLVGDTHLELIITGPVASMTTEMEAIADAGEVVVSPVTRQLLPRDFTGTSKGEGWLIRKRKVSTPPLGGREVAARDGNPASLLPHGIRDHLSSGVAESEHRIASVGFVKFTGVDALLSGPGPEAVAAELDGFVRGIQKVAADEEVTFLGTDIDKDGGKVILATGVPTARHDDEGRILRALRQIVDTPCLLAVRAGVNRGHVFAGNVGGTRRSTYTVMGDTVNLAARLMTAAGPGMLYASPGVLDLSASIFRTESLDPFPVKGKADPVRAYSVYEETGVKPPETKSELKFHGREAELDLIVSIVTTCARTGRGGMLTISGDTGVGKSRLIAEVLERCPDMAVGRVQAEPYGRDNPYWALRDPLRKLLDVTGADRESLAASLDERVTALIPALRWALPLLGDLAHIQIPDNEETAAIDPRFRPTRTAEALVDLLEAAFPGQFAWVVEDGQWLDAASFEVLRRVGEAAETRPWTVILTVRDEEGVVETLGTRVALPPLSDEAMRSIVVDATASTPLRPHELQAIVSRAGGNPLFLAEILEVVRETGSAEQIPDSLDAVVSKQIDTFPPLPRQVLRHLSVLGRSFRADVKEQFLDEAGLHLDSATSKEIDRFLEAEDDVRLRFRHTMIQAVAYGGLSYRKRRELHARAAEVIERLAGDDPDDAAEVLALHFFESGNPVKAWHYSRVAGDKALRTYANAEAASHYRRALEAGRGLDGSNKEEMAQVWSRLGQVRDLLGHYEEARDAFGRAIRLVDDPLQVADLHLRRAEAWFGSGNLVQAKRSLSLGRRSLLGAGSGSSGILARLDAYESSVHAANGDPGRASMAAHRAIENALSSGQDEALARAYGSLDWANFMMGRDEPRRGEEAVEIFHRLGLLDRSALTMNMMGAFFYFEGDWNGAVEWYQRSVVAAEASGNTFYAATTRANIAEVLISQRRIEEAMPLLREADRILRASDSETIRPFVDLQMARVGVAQGNVEDILEQLERLFADQLRAGDGFEWPETALVLSEALVLAGRPEQALGRLQQLETEMPESARRLRPGVERVRALAAMTGDNKGLAAKHIADGLDAAAAQGDLFGELLLLELMTRGGVGRTSDPAHQSRATQLADRLGVIPDGGYLNPKAGSSSK